MACLGLYGLRTILAYGLEGITVKNTLNKALLAGGTKMTIRSSRQIFGADARLHRNTMRTCTNLTLAYGVQCGVIGSHRTIEPMIKFDDVAARIVVELEARLGRKLSYDRATQLHKAYCNIRAHRLAAEGVKRLLATFMVTPQPADAANDEYALLAM